jgi:PLP dependent protein
MREPGIENLYAVQTLASTKLANLLNRHRPESHAPLRVLIQLNTSGEEVKGGIAVGADEEVARLATHVVRECPRLRLVGLMTIGAPGGGEEDFEVLRAARDRLVHALPGDGVWGEPEDPDPDGGVGAGVDGDWVKGANARGEDANARGGRRLLLSMGMSNDFELALKAGADIVRVGTSIFGARPPKKGAPSAEQS